MAIEASITKSIMDYLNSLQGCICEKIKGDSTASGRSDINGCYKGRSFKIEAKTADNRNKATKKQVYYLKCWFRAGAVVMVAYSLRFVKEVFDDPSFWAYSEHDAYLQLNEANGMVSWASAGRLSGKKERLNG